jgi:hypothetical protein
MSQRRGEPIDPRTVEHVSDCESCAAQYAEFARLMDDVRAEGEAEADAVFTPERLREQHQHIMRRVDRATRPGRVLSFPGRVMQRTFRVSALRSPRWTAAAAAAGLFLGIALGASVQWEARGRASAPTLATRSGPATRNARLVPVPALVAGDGAADEAFMLELEVALDRPHTRELAAFDAFTPHFREIRDAR